MKPTKPTKSSIDVPSIFNTAETQVVKEFNNMADQRGSQYIKPKLRQIGDFYVLDALLDYDGDRNESEEYLGQFIDMVKINIMNQYSSKFYEIPSDDCGFLLDNENEWDDYKKICADIVNTYYTDSSQRVIMEQKLQDATDKYISNKSILTRQVLEKITQANKCKPYTLMVKCSKENITCYMTLSNERKLGNPDVLIVLFDNKLKLALAFSIKLMIDHYNETDDIDQLFSSEVLSPLVIATKRRYVEYFLCAPIIQKYQFYAISIITNILGIYDKDCGCGCDMKWERKSFSHTGFEMQIINRIFNSINEDSGNSIVIHSRLNPEWMDYSKNPFVSRTVTAYKDRKIPIAVKQPKMDAPIIDFSKKEIDFMRRHLKQYKMYGGDKPLNMAEVLKNPRYGTTLILPTVIEGDETSHAIYASYDYDITSDMADFIVAFPGDHGFTIWVQFQYSNLSSPDWSFSSNLVATDLSIYRHGDVYYPSSMEELMTLVPKEFFNQSFTVNLLGDAMDLFVMIYLRPERSKVIKETTRVMTSNNHQSSKGKRYKSCDKKAENFVVRRILKTTKDAKEYIAKMSAEGSPDREYTIEEWDRVGHYRRKPNSEEKIWIKPTKCHRKLPLTDKEVHIKL